MDYLTVAANAARSQVNLNAEIEGFRQRTSSAALFPRIPSSVAVEAASPVVLDSLTISADAMPGHYIANAVLLDLQPAQMVAALTGAGSDLRTSARARAAARNPAVPVGGLAMNAFALVRGREARSTLPAPLTVAAGRQHTAETILRAWFEGKADHTIRGYRHDLEDFALYFSRALAMSPPMNVNEALSRLFKQSSPSAHEIVLGFRGYLASAHLSAASINRHLATLRSVTKLGRMLGMMSWYLEVPGVKGDPLKRLRGRGR